MWGDRYLCYRNRACLGLSVGTFQIAFRSNGKENQKQCKPYHEYFGWRRRALLSFIAETSVCSLIYHDHDERNIITSVWQCWCKGASQTAIILEGAVDHADNKYTERFFLGLRRSAKEERLWPKWRFSGSIWHESFPSQGFYLNLSFPQDCWLWARAWVRENILHTWHEWSAFCKTAGHERHTWQLGVGVSAIYLFFLTYIMRKFHTI